MRRILTLSLVAATVVAITLACTREGRADAGSATKVGRRAPLAGAARGGPRRAPSRPRR